MQLRLWLQQGKLCGSDFDSSHLAKFNTVAAVPATQMVRLRPAILLLLHDNLFKPILRSCIILMELRSGFKKEKIILFPLWIPSFNLSRTIKKKFMSFDAASPPATKWNGSGSTTMILLFDNVAESHSFDAAPALALLRKKYAVSVPRPTTSPIFGFHSEKFKNSYIYHLPWGFGSK
jgi:hypothetical protein